MKLAHIDRRTFAQPSVLLHPWAYGGNPNLTPHQTEGPFYPDKMPLDTDNDLIILNDSLTPAVGQYRLFKWSGFQYQRSSDKKCASRNLASR